MSTAATINHKFVSGKADGPDPTLIQPSKWNQNLNLGGGNNGEIVVRDTAQPDGLGTLPISTILPLGVYNVMTYGAKGDGQSLTNGAITTGTPNFTSASNPFVAGDVGKRISVAGAGAAGVTLETTILAFVSAGAVTLAANAGTTVTGANTQWGTDDTAAVQAALNAAKVAGVGRGQVYFPAGKYFTSALNLTNTNGIHLQGTGYYGSQLWPWASGINFLDCTGSQQVVFKDLWIGGPSGPGSLQASIPNTALLLAANSAGNGLDFEAANVYIVGRWAKAAVYNFGFAGAVWQTSHLYNYNVAAGARTLFVTNTNDDALTSTFATISAGTPTPNYQQFDNCDIEEWINNGTTVTNGRAISLKGVSNVHFARCQIIGQKGTAYIDLAGVLNNLSWEGGTFETGGSTVPTSVFNFVTAPTITGFALPGNNFNYGTSLLTGAVTTLDPKTGGMILNFNSNPTTAIAAGSTRYIGGNGDGSADLQVTKYVPTRGVVTQLFAGVNNAPGVGQSYTVTARVNDVNTAIVATISGATATVAQDTVDYKELAKFDRVSLQFVSSAGAATAFVGGTLAFLPF